MLLENPVLFYSYFLVAVAVFPVYGNSHFGKWFAILITPLVYTYSAYIVFKQQTVIKGIS